MRSCAGALDEAARATVVERYSPQARAAELAQLLPEILKTRAGRRMEAEQPMQANEQAEQQGGERRTSRKWTPPEDRLPGRVSSRRTPFLEEAGEGFTPLTIHWIVSEPIAGSGGHAGIFRMIRHLVDFGHVCHVHIVPIHFMHRYSPAQIEHWVNEQFVADGRHLPPVERADRAGGRHGRHLLAHGAAAAAAADAGPSLLFCAGF